MFRRVRGVSKTSGDWEPRLVMRCCFPHVRDLYWRRCIQAHQGQAHRLPLCIPQRCRVDLPKWCSASTALEANFTNKPRSNKRKKGWFSSFLFAFAPNPRIYRRSPSPRPTQPGQSFPKLSCPRRIVSYPCFIYATEPFGTPCLSTHIHSMTHRNIPTSTPKPPFSLCLT